MRKNIVVLLILTIELIYFILVYVIPSPNYDEKGFDIDKIKYNNISRYSSSCNEKIIMSVAIVYKNRGQYKKCKEWIRKRDYCISLHPEYKDLKYKEIYFHACDIIITPEGITKTREL